MNDLLRSTTVILKKLLLSSKDNAAKGKAILQLINLDRRYLEKLNAILVEDCITNTYTEESMRLWYNELTLKLNALTNSSTKTAEIIRCIIAAQPSLKPELSNFQPNFN